MRSRARRRWRIVAFALSLLPESAGTCRAPVLEPVRGNRSASRSVRPGVEGLHGAPYLALQFYQVRTTLSILVLHLLTSLTYRAGDDIWTRSSCVSSTELPGTINPFFISMIMQQTSNPLLLQSQQGQRCSIPKYSGALPKTATSQATSRSLPRRASQRTRYSRTSQYIPIAFLGLMAHCHLHHLTGEKGDIIKFYNFVFIPQLESFLLQFQAPPGATTVTTGASLPTPASPHPSQSPMRVAASNVYLSPMHPSSTPRSISNQSSTSSTYSFGLSPSTKVCLALIMLTMSALLIIT